MLSKVLFFFSIPHQCSRCGVQPLSDVSVNVERATQPKMEAGSGQGWQSWVASSSAWDESKWDKKVPGGRRGTQRLHESSKK